MAAKLLAKVVDPGRVDAIVGLGVGTTRGWFDNDKDFRRRANEERQRIDLYRKPDVDYTRALEPKQILVAGLLAEGRTQEEVGREVGVTARTIRNWNCDPVFHDYVRELTEQEAQRRSRARSAEAAEERARLQRLRAAAVAAAEDIISGDDPKARQAMTQDILRQIIRRSEGW